MRHKSGSVTIYDIANEAGVSVSTVSRVINNKSTVKKATRDRVLEVLNKNNFSPNEAARGLVTQSSRMIGVLISDIRTTQHTDGIYFVERELAANGYSCLIHNTTRNTHEMVRYIKELCRWNVEGVVLLGSVYANDEVAAAIEAYLPKKPVVICNGYIKKANVYCILSDEKAGVKDSMRLLYEKGKKHPAMLINQITPSNLKKEEGFRAGLAEYFPDEKPVVIYGGSTEAEVAELTKEIFEDRGEIDAIIYAEDSMAVIGLRALWDCNKRIPEDVAVIGINNSLVSQISVPRLTSVDNQLYSLSVSAANNLLTLLNGKHVSHKIVIPAKVVEREST